MAAIEEVLVIAWLANSQAWELSTPSWYANNRVQSGL